MASMLAVGAGASEGLDQILQRLMMEQQLAQSGQKISEESRHNKATEANSSHQMELLAKQREDALQEKRDAQIERTVSARGIGDPVTESEYGKETGAGFPSGDYSIKPGHKVSTLAGFSSLPGSVSGMTGQGSAAAPVEGKSTATEDDANALNTPRLISFKGTEAQRLARDKEEKGGNVNESQKTFKIKDPALAQQFGLKVGDVFDPLLNPRTGKYTYRGVDVTNGIEHYEKPQPTLYTPIQSDENYLRFNRKTGKFEDSSGQEVKNPPLATPGQVRSREDLASRVASHFDEVQNLLDDAEKSGALGVVRGRLFTDFLAGRVGSTGNGDQDELLGELRQNMTLARSGLAQLHGRGGANVGIVQGLEKNMDEGHMDYRELTGALRAMKNWVNTYATKKGAGPAATSTGGVPTVGSTFQGGKVLKVTPVP